MPGRLTLVLISAAVAIGAPSRKDLGALLDGVKRIGVPGVPGLLSVYGKDAFPVVAAPAGGSLAPVVAAARAKRGRLVVLAHNGWFGEVLREEDTGTLLGNLLRWAAAKSRRVRVGVRGHRFLLGFLPEQGFEVVDLGGGDWTPRLDDVDVACLPVSDAGGKELAALRGFLESGGGIVTGVPGWGWQQLNPGKDLATANGVNRLAAPYGLVVGHGTIEVPRDKRLPASAPLPNLHASRALDALASNRRLDKGQRARAVYTLTRCLRDLPPDDQTILPRVRTLLRRADRRLPAPRTPLRDEDGLAKVLLAHEILEERRSAPREIVAHPAAEAFPGAVPRASPRVAREVEASVRTRAWVSTGLYAAPGDRVRVTIASPVPGLRLRIGAHADALWDKPQWRRAPDVSRVFDLTDAETIVASAFGGLIYVETPKRGAQVALRIEGAVEAPWFRLGTTTPEEWRRVRRHPAPWAELATDKVILTVPSEFVRDLEDPETLMRFWDRVLDAAADLAVRPRERARPERYVADTQISAGYMHAGYPIMTHLDAAPRFVDLDRLSRLGDWGMFHELGHNHQHPDWTFAGTGEVTCNLFTLYILETVCSGAEVHKSIAPATRGRTIEAHRKAGAPFGVWKSRPFLALVAYVQLKEAFGWETFKKVFAEYRDLPGENRPRNDAEKRDQWLVRFSRACGHDLGPFFEAWGIPVSESARRQVAELPAWLPDEMR